MRDINRLSRIGFGCYRVSSRSPIHRAALVSALHHGCNLIDTASNYSGGESEELVGDVLSTAPEIDAFVVTKAGYVIDADMPFLDSPAGAEALTETVTLAGGTRHCIHPAFLKRQIGRSLQRLRRTTIDGFLLHNPEYYFDENGGPEAESAFYRRIGAAFATLEACCDAGVIRFYGVSSNALSAGSAAAPSISLPRLIETAAQTRRKGRFRLLEFPCNMLETEALEPAPGFRSVVDLAAAHGLKTLANRPLNAKLDGKAVRLAEGAVVDAIAPAKLDTAFIAVRQTIEERSGTAAYRAIMDNLSALQAGWSRIDQTDIAEAVFLGVFFPALDTLFDGDIPPAARQASMHLYVLATQQARASMQDATAVARSRFVQAGAIDAGDRRPLSVIACDTLLRRGVGHVLVGMRRPDYVEGLKGLF